MFLGVFFGWGGEVRFRKLKAWSVIIDKFTAQQQTKIVQLYFENQHLIVLMQRAYQRESNVRNPLSDSIIHRFIVRFQQTGPVYDLPGSRRPCSACPE